MAKGPAVIGVLTEPPAPSWWKANRHKVFLILGLIAGYYIGIHTSEAAPQHADPRPGHTGPATPSSRPSPTGS